MADKQFRENLNMKIKFDWFDISISLIILYLLFWFFFTIRSARAEISYPKELWKGLIAEATSDGYSGLYSVACCVRNRLNKGMSVGLVSLKRRDLDAFVKKEGHLREQQAKEIVKLVFEENSYDITLGATHFENVERFGLPSWAKNMQITKKIKSHTYFKERN